MDRGEEVAERKQLKGYEKNSEKSSRALKSILKMLSLWDKREREGEAQARKLEPQRLRGNGVDQKSPTPQNTMEQTNLNVKRK